MTSVSDGSPPSSSTPAGPSAVVAPVTSQAVRFPCRVLQLCALCNRPDAAKKFCDRDEPSDRPPKSSDPKPPVGQDPPLSLPLGIGFHILADHHPQQTHCL